MEEILPPLPSPLRQSPAEFSDRLLGDDDDSGLQTISNLEQATKLIRQEFDRGGRIPAIGLAWALPHDAPIPRGLGRSFLAISPQVGIDDTQYPSLIAPTKASEMQRWLTVRPLPSTEPIEQRAIHLVRSLVAARIAGVPLTFATDVISGDAGLVRPDGAPTPLYLPWRTSTLALQGTKYVGSLRMKNQSTNHIFERNGEGIVVLMAPEPTTETMNLGDKVVLQEIWGRQTPLPRIDGRQLIPVSQTPVFLTGCAAQLPKWDLAVGFENTRLASLRGAQPNAIVGRNTFNRPVTAEVSMKLPRGWEANPSTWSINVAANEAFRLPTEITLSDDASLGDADIQIDFQVLADRPEHIEVVRTLGVGLGDVEIDVIDRKLEDGRLELEQIVINNTKPEEVLEFRCNLSVSGQKRQTRFVSGLRVGEDRKLYHLPNADALKGQELRLNLEQLNGRRNLNKRMVIGREWK